MYLALCRLVRCFVVIVYSVCDGQMSYILPDWSLSDYSTYMCVLYIYIVSTYIWYSWFPLQMQFLQLQFMNNERRIDLARLDWSWTVSLLGPICTELDSYFPFSHFPFPPSQWIVLRFCLDASLLQSIINHITEIPKYTVWGI